VLEIVERILAALIILALLTLLIILAFPVPARQTPGPAPSTARNEDRPAAKSEPPKKDVAARDKTPEQPAKDTPKTDVGGASNGQTEADARAEDARRRAEDDAKRRAEDDARRRADRADEDARRRAEEDARRRENADHDRRRPGRSIQPAEARDCADPDCRRPIRRAGTRGCPNGSDGCGCADERRGRVVTRRSTLPYWAEPRRRYAVRDEDPDWFDERADDPGPPPGACPD